MYEQVRATNVMKTTVTGHLVLKRMEGYSGDAGDAFERHSGQKFTTKDRDNDQNSGNCAVQFSGAWWYNDCHFSNLNGLYLGGSHESNANGVNWYHWKGYHYSLKFTEMKLRQN